MKFKGTIIITDPCYLSQGMSEEQDNKFWKECDYGEDLSVIGLSQWISDSTIYGDWSCFTYKGTKKDNIEEIRKWDRFSMNFFKEYNFVQHTQEEKDQMYADYSKKHQAFVEKLTYGQFCADAGMVCVCYLDEVLKFNPEFKKWAEEHSWCVTIIKDFEGDINYEVDEYETVHIVGIGNKNFYTSQSGF